MNQLYSFKTVLSVFIILFFASCDPSRVYEENKQIPESEWYYKNRIPFEAEISDTSVYYNIYLNFRISSDYSFSNIFVLLHSTNPDKMTTKNRREFILADDRGKWLGSGLGDLYDYRFLAFEKVNLPKSGLYRFEIEQNMRVDTLNSVIATGLRIEKAEAK